MKKWNTLASAKTPDGSTLALVEHDGEYLLRVDGRELMSTARHASELRLGALGAEVIARRPKARALIGGLGLGFTLRGLLAGARPDAAITVAELMPEVVAWNREPTWPLAHAELADPRVEVALGDVFEVLARGRYDAILLDADNGTTAMMTRGNQALYQRRGIERVRAALSDGGVVIYWSAERDRPFAAALEKAGFVVRTEGVRAYGTGGPYHTLIIAKKAKSA